MILSYFKIAIRNLLKYKSFSFINIAGLSLGLACTFIILFHVIDEFSFDKFHKNSNSIYRLTKEFNQDGKFWGRITYPEGNSIENRISDVKNVTVITRSFSPKIKFDNQFIQQSAGIYADTNFLKIFSVELLQGKNNKQLYDPYTVLLSEKLASKLFGRTEALSSSITIKSSRNIAHLRVSGVFRDFPKNSTIKAEMIIPTLLLESSSITDLGECCPNFEAYLHIPNGNSVETLENQILSNREPDLPQKPNFTYHLLPFTDMRLFASHVGDKMGTAKNIDDIYIYCSIAFLILTIACINFIILTTARTSQKGKEVGIRKLIGAGERHINFQFIGEAALSTFIAIPFSLLLFDLLLPFFNEVTGKDLEFILSDQLFFLLCAVLISVLVSFISGAFISSKYNKTDIVDVLKNQIFTTRSKLWLRRFLIVVQLSVAVILIVCSVIIIEQISFLGNKDLGFNKERIVVFTYPIFDNSKIEILKNYLRTHSNILNVTSSTHMPPSNITSNGSITMPDDPEKIKKYEFISVDYDYFETMGIDFIKGRNYSREYSSDTANAIIVNEEFVREFNLKDYLNKPLEWFRDNRIIGVVNDFHIRGLYEKIPHAVFYLSPGRGWQLAIKISSVRTSETIAFIKNEWSKLNPEEVFSYNFVDEKFDQLYKQEQNFVKIIGSSSIMAIFITCMGILGLMILTVEQRTKEIGMRKVLGAPVYAIVNLLTKEFLIYVLISTIVASPFAFYFMNKWLENFAYKISISFLEFALAAALILIVTFLTIAIQIAKAAFVNPVESLRNE